MKKGTKIIKTDFNKKYDTNLGPIIVFEVCVLEEKKINGKLNGMEFIDTRRILKLPNM